MRLHLSPGIGHSFAKTSRKASRSAHERRAVTEIDAKQSTGPVANGGHELSGRPGPHDRLLDLRIALDVDRRSEAAGH